MTDEKSQTHRLNVNAAYAWQEEARREQDRQNKLLIAALVASAGGKIIVTDEVRCDAVSYSLTVKENPKSAQTTYSVEIEQ